MNMLSKEEKQRLAGIQRVVKSKDINNQIHYSLEFIDLKSLQWLIDKLNETNAELEKVYEEVALHARAEHPELYITKNEISDRFYPR
jgi:hypothetical protein